MEGRGALVDNVTTLRQILEAAPIDADALYVLHNLFLQQRVKRRKTINTSSKSVCTPGGIAKALLVRRSLYLYLQDQFPELASVMAPYASYKSVLDKYGVDAHGMRKANSRVPDEEDSGEEESTEKADDSGQMYSIRSKMLLRQFCDSLAGHRHEKTLITMA